ncbi:unnamed protein product [Spodoptera littoralis]|uniref:Uncharacterized protein n=1 Tax=Spodoptera littoralis TaxID=7109 RepID=A0A9P0N407_SPOLI|nr:unnamed protein product [Spodoptera littoralis]CAH1641638.1 unnamed protein product [Spodoptera littoralis]
MISKLICVVIASVVVWEPSPNYCYDERTLPPDMADLFRNKSDQELIFEDCLNSYSLCMTFERERNHTEICSIEINIKKTFKSFCEMVYENCKGDNNTWRYFHDGPCDVEFVEEAAYQGIFFGSPNKESHPPSVDEKLQEPDATGDTHPPGGAGETHPPSGAGETHPPGGAKDTHPPGGAKDTHPPGTAGDTHPPGGAGNKNPPGSAFDTHPPGSAGNKNPPGGAGDIHPPGDFGDKNPPGSAFDTHPPGSAGNKNPPGGAGDIHPPGDVGDKNPPGGAEETNAGGNLYYQKMKKKCIF